jgi:tetratricopeptide (TPR) repeat protein/transcriptional regulator with XRE-family HTH domain
MGMPHKPASKAYRDQQRERLVKLGLDGHQLIEQLVAALMRCGRRPREAWRLAQELTQNEVAARFNRIRNDSNFRMRGSRICEYEKWPMGGVRPSVRTLKTLAVIYQTTWDGLVDVDDLTRMPAGDRQAFLDAGDLRYGNALDLAIPRQRGHRTDATYGDDEPQRHGPIMVEERLAVPAPGPLSERPGSALPGEITHFTGRDGPLAELRARITEQASQDTVVTIFAIDGMAGVGKTAFARHAAQEFAKAFPDGAIWVDLYGHTPGMRPREPFGALEQMLLQLGVPPEAMKADLAERQDQWRHRIYARRVLIVLDNALSSDQILPLLPETPGCLVLITSRRKLTGLTDAYPLSLDVLEWEEAERLFVKLVGAQRCKDREAVRQILTACGRLPLALRLIAGRLRHHRDEQLADVAADFADQTAALDAFVAEHLSVRSVFEWSYRLLTDEQRRAFRLLGWHPGPAITPVVIAAMADVSPARGKRVLRELVDHNLLDPLSVAGVPGGPRYRMHDLVRLYARECADFEEPPTERAAAVKRLAASYAAITREADRMLRPYVSGDAGKSDARGSVLTFVDAVQARTWLTAERHNLVGCVGAMSPSTDAADLSTVLAVHFRDFGFWSNVRYLYGQALTAYRHLGDQPGEVDALWGLGEVQRRVGEYSQAREYHTQALTLARQLGYRRGEALALWGLGQVERLVGEYRRARKYHTQALVLARQLGYRRGEADALWGLGQVERRVGEYGQAREYHMQALILARQLGYRRGEALALWGLAHVERLVGEYRRARDYHAEGLALVQHLGDRPGEVLALWGLGEVERRAGDYDRAREYHTHALALARQLGDRPAEVNALWGLGEVERLVGEYGQAREYHTRALDSARHLGYRRGEVLALRGLGHVERLVGEYGQAREHYTRALTLARHLGDRPDEILALWGLGEIERRVGEYGQAREYHTQALTLARHLGDQPEEILALWGLGEVERRVGEYGQAREYHTQALALARHLGDRPGEVWALRGLGEVERLVGQYGQARDYHIQALALARRLGDRPDEVLALRGLGEVEWRVGEYGQAREYHTQALALARQLGDRPSEVWALRALGEVERRVGEYGQAREYHTQALALARQLGDRPGEVLALRGLGEVQRLIGQYDQARQYQTQALALARHLGDRLGEVLALRGLGEVQRLIGHYDQARQYHTQALTFARNLGYRLGEADALRGLGEVERLIGHYEQARQYHTQALTFTRNLGDRSGEAEALWALGQVASDTAERGQACELWQKALEIHEQLGVPFAETIRAAMRQLGCC